MRTILLALMLVLVGGGRAPAATLQVLTSGAYRAALEALAPMLAKDMGHTLVVQNATAGVVAQRVYSTDPVDIIILPPANAAPLGPLIGPLLPLARVGIGMAIKEGAPKPDISSLAAIRATVLAARAPGWIDPKAGGSSGVAIEAVWESWGIASQLAPRAVLVQGGLVADKLRDGTADLGFQQMSELIGAPGITVLGPLPPEIQSYTTYAGAVPTKSSQAGAANEALRWLAGPQAAPTLRLRGMEPP